MVRAKDPYSAFSPNLSSHHRHSVLKYKGHFVLLAAALSHNPSMTEYDYSPEAYERYVRKQQAIARWVDNTNLHTPANPFVPLPDASSSTYRSQDRGLNVDYERPSSSRRSYSYDPDGGHRTQHARQVRHMSRKHSSPASASYIYSSQPAHGHNVQPQIPYRQGQHPYNPPVTKQYDSPYDSSLRTPTASPPPQPSHNPQSSQPAVIPINDGKGSYFLVPPKGATYQAVVSSLRPFCFFFSGLSHS
jgi:hypothetical protein